MQWEAVIGLEIHVQLATKSKLFSGAATAYGVPPNTQACAIDLALPGVLPVLNANAVQMAVKFGLGIQAEINKASVFDRKNYFYPDLPKGYQISQFYSPIIRNGLLEIPITDDQILKVRIHEAHLEEDAGKSLHEDFHGMSGIDLNRAGTPLLEIVTAPDMRSAKEAVTCLKAIHSLVRYLDISDANMQEGSFRCDANVSVRPVGQQEYGTRTETKNLNSFRFVERAINYEIERQIQILEAGGQVCQETRLYDAERDETRSMRSKEEATEYRYFPDPDLLPVILTDEYIAEIKAQLPELPTEKRARFQTEYELNTHDADALTSSKALADYFEGVAKRTQASPKIAANWIRVELLGALNKAGLEITESPISAQQLAQLLDRIADNTISGKIAKTVFEAMWQGAGSADQIIEQKGLKQITDTSTIVAAIEKIIADNPEQVAQYQAGQEKLFGYFVGQVMKLTKGKANPQQVNELLRNRLTK